MTDSHLKTLRAAVDRMVPADDFPSGSEAGCVEFLVKLINLERLEDTYRLGIERLETEAGKMGGSFAELSPANQDAILHRLRNGRDLRAKRFISMLARQTIEGYYSDPGNGGNLGEVAWKMVGFEVRA